MIEYDSKAQVARAFLTQRYNDVDVYVEDRACQNMYVRLINRILGDAAVISTVFPMGGRQALLDRCAADQERGGRKRLYLMDADFDLMLQKPVPQLRHCYRLSAYCIENLLISEHSLVEIALESSTDTPRDDLRTKLQIDLRLSQATAVLLPLFVIYGIASELDVPVQTSSFPVVRLCGTQTDPNTLSQRLIRQRIRYVLGQILTCRSRGQYRAAKRKVRSSIDQWTRPCHHLISGKTYLLPLAHCLLRSVTGFRDSMDALKVRLAAHCGLDIDPDFASRLKELICEARTDVWE
jgi:hypothetical protein